MQIRIVFMGSPEFALPTLRALVERYAVVGVVTQPDRPAGRGRALTQPPVKELALTLGVPVIQPQRLKAPEAMEQLQAWQPDLIVVAAFGQILRPAVLDLPPHGCLNVHASLLPRWRGAAPVQAAILHGDRQSGVTIMRMDPGVDTGPVISQRETLIEPQETSGELGRRLAEMGAELLIETLPAYLRGELQPQPQPETGVSYAPMLAKADAELDFSKPADELVRRVRAFNPWPGAYFIWPGGRLIVHKAQVIPGSPSSPGRCTVHHGLPAVTTGDGLLLLELVQPGGKQAMPGEVFLRGARNWLNDRNN